MGTYITFPELLIWLPLLAGILCFFIKRDSAVKSFSIFFSLAILAVSVASLFFTAPAFATWNSVNYFYTNNIGNTFFVGLDGTGRMLTFLTALSFPAILIATKRNGYKNSSSFYGLMFLAQAGLMGVFVSLDALLFYFFWELALIPVYFLSSIWGGEKRIQATFKFFVYTFIGSLLMLTGIIYIYLHTPGRAFEDGTRSLHSFALSSFQNAFLTVNEQQGLFWLFFAAFAVKMPVFPFHTWQPDAYDQSPTPVTMVMSGLMVKMGLYGVIRWLVPLFPAASEKYSHIVILLAVTGVVYASCMAMVQDNLKKLVAYSSIAHIGLMCAAIFTMNQVSMQGVLLQMFNHGINIIGMWIVLYLLEQQTGVKEISKLSGVANKAPVLTILFVIIALANIALPLTNAFAGEFMMFSGLYRFNGWYAAIAGLGIILAAVYTLNMIQKVFYGNTNTVAETVKDISWNERFILAAIVLLIFILGVYPQPVLDLTKDTVAGILERLK